MTLEEFLEKYNCDMNSTKIAEIEDLNIQVIKKKYWDLKHKAFLDEYKIKDWELGEELDKYTALERKDLEEYYNSISNK